MIDFEFFSCKTRSFMALLLAVALCWSWLSPLSCTASCVVVEKSPIQVKYTEKLFFFICFVMIAMNLAPMKSIATTSEETPTGKIDCLYFFEKKKNSFIDCKFVLALAPSQSTTSTSSQNEHASEMIYCILIRKRIYSLSIARFRLSLSLSLSLSLLITGTSAEYQKISVEPYSAGYVALPASSRTVTTNQVALHALIR